MRPHEVYQVLHLWKTDYQFISPRHRHCSLLVVVGYPQWKYKQYRLRRKPSAMRLVVRPRMLVVGLPWFAWKLKQRILVWWVIQSDNSLLDNKTYPLSGKVGNTWGGFHLMFEYCLKWGFYTLKCNFKRKTIFTHLCKLRSRCESCSNQMFANYFY